MTLLATLAAIAALCLHGHRDRRRIRDRRRAMESTLRAFDQAPVAIQGYLDAEFFGRPVCGELPCYAFGCAESDFPYLRALAILTHHGYLNPKGFPGTFAAAWYVDEAFLRALLLRLEIRPRP